MVWALVLMTQVLLSGESCQLKTVCEKLPNGSQIIVAICPTFPYSVASLWVKCGSASDPPNREGTAHLLEHLLPLKPFNGTPIQIAIENEGALLVPETGRDFMAFHLQASPETVAKVFPMLTEAVAGLDVDLEVVEREKELMRLEALALYEDPLWLMKTALEAKLFAGTPYAHPPTGWLETLNPLSLADAQQFYRSHFVAPNLALIAAVPNEETLTVLKRAMAELSFPTETPATPTASTSRGFLPAFEGLLQETLTRPNEVFWGMGWRVTIGAREKVAADALVLHLRQVLLPALLGQIGVVREWNMVANPVRGELALTVTARLRPHTELIERRLKQAIGELSKRSLTATELDFLKRSLQLEHLRALSDPLRCVKELGWAWALYGDPTVFERYAEVLQNLNADQIRQLAARLNSAQPVVWVVKK